MLAAAATEFCHSLEVGDMNLVVVLVGRRQEAKEPLQVVNACHFVLLFFELGNPFLKKPSRKLRASGRVGFLGSRGLFVPATVGLPEAQLGVIPLVGRFEETWEAQ